MSLAVISAVACVFWSQTSDLKLLKCIVWQPCSPLLPRSINVCRLGCPFRVSRPPKPRWQTVNPLKNLRAKLVDSLQSVAFSVETPFHPFDFAEIWLEVWEDGSDALCPFSLSACRESTPRCTIEVISRNFPDPWTSFLSRTGLRLDISLSGVISQIDKDPKHREERHPCRSHPLTLSLLRDCATPFSRSPAP